MPNALFAGLALGYAAGSLVQRTCTLDAPLVDDFSCPNGHRELRTILMTLDRHIRGKFLDTWYETDVNPDVLWVLRLAQIRSTQQVLDVFDKARLPDNDPIRRPAQDQFVEASRAAMLEQEVAAQARSTGLDSLNDWSGQHGEAALMSDRLGLGPEVRPLILRASYNIRGAAEECALKVLCLGETPSIEELWFLANRRMTEKPCVKRMPPGFLLEFFSSWGSRFVREVNRELNRDSNTAATWHALRSSIVRTAADASSDHDLESIGSSVPQEQVENVQEIDLSPLLESDPIRGRIEVAMNAGVQKSAIESLTLRICSELPSIHLARDEVRDAVDILTDVASAGRGSAADSTGLRAVLARIAELSAAGKHDEACEETDVAYERWRQEYPDRFDGDEPTWKPGLAIGVALLEAGISQDMLRRDFESAGWRRREIAYLKDPMANMTIR